MLHIGKTGGTAVKHALQQSSCPGRRFVLHPHRTTLAHIAEGEKCFFFVRDPVARFVSGFLSRQRQGRPRYDVPWTQSERTGFTQFSSANELALALSSPDDPRRHAAETAMSDIIHVRDHYWRWFGDEAYLSRRRGDILFVGAQEQLERDISELSRIVGLAIDLPDDEVGAHRNPLGAPRELEGEAVANLRRWYAQDYAFLALLREWFPHLPDYRKDRES